MSEATTLTRTAAGPRVRLPAAGMAIVLMVGLVGCDSAISASGEQPTPITAGESREARASTVTPSSAPRATRSKTATVNRTVTFVSVVDGDTIETSAGTVRIIGIDTPERGECGHDRASAAIERILSAGDRVVLKLPRGENDRDAYERLIRYVTTSKGVDVGLMQLTSGNAVARYDSTDGYPAHPYEAAYHKAQIASLAPDGSVLTTSCRKQTLTGGTSSTGAKWWEKYSSCSKLKKNDLGHPTGPFRRDDPDQATIYDWFANRTGNHGDGDGDGLACE